MRISRTALLVVVCALPLSALAAQAQEQEAQQEPEAAAAVLPAVQRPFRIGEKLTYAVRVGPLGRGTAVAELQNADTVRGKHVYHSVFRITGSMLFFKVRDNYESWFDPTTLISMRYYQDIDQGAYERDRKYEIFAERGVYKENDKPEVPTVELPLDDGAFLYFLRTIPLEVGKTYSFNRYFKPDRNPVRVTVLRKERIRVPAGEFDAIVLQPSIRAKGIFAESAHAEVWLAEGEGRIMLAMKTNLPFGPVQFQLRSREITKESVAER